MNFSSDQKFLEFDEIYESIEMLQNNLDEWLREYNESRPHSGKYCYGKTPMQTFLDSQSLAKEKMQQYSNNVCAQRAPSGFEIASVLCFFQPRTKGGWHGT